MKQASRGFTIIEVLMFLAISGVMFTIAFWGTQSTQDNVRFRDSLNSIEAKLREVFDNVDDGYFANSGGYECTPSGSDWVSSGSGGGNSSCIFIGKEIHFSDSSTMAIETILGDRSNPATTNKPNELVESYQIKNSVQFDRGTATSIKAIRSADAGSDIRASRQKFSGGTWGEIGNSPVTFCFKLGDKLGSVTVLSNDITVQYARTACPS